jgi:hypothetical protein
MKKTTSQFANEIYHMSLKARYASEPQEARRCRILMTVFLKEILRMGQGSHVDIASRLLAENGETCSKDQAMVLAGAAIRNKVDFGKIIT